MKINNSGRIGVVQQYQKNSIPAGPAYSRGKIGKDELHISDAAKELLGANRSERIEELKQSVENGTYQVEASKLAEKLLPYLKS